MNFYIHNHLKFDKYHFKKFHQPSNKCDIFHVTDSDFFIIFCAALQKNSIRLNS